MTDSSTDFLLRRLGDETVGQLKGHRDAEHESIRLNQMPIIPCQACGEAPTQGFCIYHDLDDIYAKVAECDCLLFGSPIYFDSVSAQAKLFIDRCNCFRPPDFKNVDPEHDFIKVLKRKRPGAMVLVGGEDVWFEGARRVLIGFFKWIEVVNEGIITYASADYNQKGMASNDVKTLTEVDVLAAKLAIRLRSN